MAKSSIPIQVVPVSIVTYSIICRLLLRGTKQGVVDVRLRAISAAHASVATLVILLALSASPLRFPAPTGLVTHRGPKYTLDGNLDDTGNPLIKERSSLANAVTAWETGYLLYDTWALVRSANPTSSGFVESIGAAARKQPAIFGHHLALSSAFLFLQHYIYRGRERGIWIIIAFLLMNASNPLLHARWWMRQQDRASRRLDITFAVVFAVSRFGLVGWVLQRYAVYHNIGAWDAFKKLRSPCQAGTSTLVGLNALWWMILVKNLMKKSLRGSR
jgi:TLC domain